MPGMSRANAAKYLEAAQGVMPIPPDFSKPSYAPDRKRLAELVALAEAGDAASLRANGIRVFYTGAQALDRYRHKAIIAIEAAPGWRPPRRLSREFRAVPVRGEAAALATSGAEAESAGGRSSRPVPITSPSSRRRSARRCPSCCDARR
jgi:hypothetical protein